jgi:hypothetical protein
MTGAEESGAAIPSASDGMTRMRIAMEAPRPVTRG